jgi:SagB-type dehydrogenase family enzyme
MMDAARSRLVGAAAEVAAGLVALFASAMVLAQTQARAPSATATPAELALPAPRVQGHLSLEGALSQRRSLRSFDATPLTAAEAGQLLWAAQGLSNAQGQRTAPSAGATYPLVLYFIAGRIDGVASGVYRYLPHGHRLVAMATGDVRAGIAEAALGQSWLRDAPALVLIAAQPARTAARYGARAERFVAIEAGAAAQNLSLQAVALGLGSTLVGAFDEAALRRSVPLAEGEQPLAIVPVGRHRQRSGSDREHP